MLTEPIPHLPRAWLWAVCVMTVASSAAAGAATYRFVIAALRLSGPAWLRHSDWLQVAPILTLAVGLVLAAPLTFSSASCLGRAAAVTRAASVVFLGLALAWPLAAQTAAAPLLVLPTALALATVFFAALLQSLRSAGVQFLTRGGLRFALEPVKILTGFTVVILLVVSSSAYGAVYGSMVVAASYGCLALLLGHLEQATTARGISRSAVTHGALVTSAAFVVWVTHAWGNNGVLHHVYGSRLFLAYGDHNTQHIVVYDSPAGPELFIDGKLEAAALDDDRLARSLAAIVPTYAKRVLVLGTGSGVVQKAIATRVAFTHLITVAPSPNVARFAARVPWLRERSLRSDPRLELIVDEPYAWLEQTDQFFDAIVCNLPPPISHRDSKHYTRHFLRTLAARLTPQGRAIVHGLSPRNTPEAHRALLEAADPMVAAVHTVSVPSVGDWTLLEIGAFNPGYHPTNQGSTLNNPQAAHLFMSHM